MIGGGRGATIEKKASPIFSSQSRFSSLHISFLTESHQGLSLKPTTQEVSRYIGRANCAHQAVDPRSVYEAARTCASWMPYPARCRATGHAAWTTTPERPREPLAAEWLRGGHGPEPERRSVHVRASGGRMAVSGFFSAVRAAPWLWRRAAAGLPGHCPGKGYTVGPAQVRTVQVSRSAELVVRPGAAGGRSCRPSPSTVRGLLVNGLDKAADLKCAWFLS